MTEKNSLHPQTPVLVGGGQYVQRPSSPETPLSPLKMMEKAARIAAADSTQGDKIWSQIDNVTTVRFIADAPAGFAPPIARYSNPPQTLANALGAKNAQTFYGPTGGNTPQYLINLTAEAISRGECRAALIAGAECLDSIIRALKKGETPDWDDNPSQKPNNLGSERPGTTHAEKKHGLELPINAYPLFENAICSRLGHSVSEHQKALGALMSPFSHIAAKHPQAWFPTARPPEDIAQASSQNRMVGFPYTKYMNAVMRVNQGAAVILTSVEKAREMGIPSEKWVFLHGCADANDLWFLSERENFHASPAIRLMGEKALNMAGWDISQINFIDLYSCFPSAVQMGRDALGIEPSDPRPLTLTGGLPYFGGAGNNYAMHAVVTLMEKLRQKPGSRGLSTANGWFVTKHAIGLYSTTPVKGRWQRENPADYQKEIDQAPHPSVIEKPQGKALIETFTIIHDRNGPKTGLIIGRLAQGNARFVAHTPKSQAIFDSFMKNGAIGKTGSVVHQEDGINLFTPD